MAMRTSRRTGDRGKGYMWSEFVGSHIPDLAIGSGVLRCAMGYTRQGPLCREETIEGLVARLLIDPDSYLHAQAHPASSPTGFTNALNHLQAVCIPMRSSKRPGSL